jgi:hypothetical protein
MEECRRERIGHEVQPETRPSHPAPTPLVQETDRLLRKIDHQLDSLMSSKNVLLRMREQLVTPQS